MRRFLILVLVGCGSSTPVASAPPKPVPGDAAEAAADDADDWPGFATEAIGGLRPGLTAAEATAKLGPPRAQSPGVLEGATGGYASTWSFADGVTLEMLGDTETGPFVARMVTIEAPSALRTTKGLGIGSATAEIATAYGSWAKPLDDGTGWLVGSPYAGLLFAVTNGKVTSISLGPFAF